MRLTVMPRSALRVAANGTVAPAVLMATSASTPSGWLLDTKIGQAQTRGFHSSADDALTRWLDIRRELASRKGWKNGKLFSQLNATAKVAMTPCGCCSARPAAKGRLALPSGSTGRPGPTFASPNWTPRVRLSP